MTRRYVSNNPRSGGPSAEDLRGRQWGQSGVRGVYLTPNGRYAAKITCNGRVHYVGTFDTKAEAEQAVREREKTVWEASQGTSTMTDTSTIPTCPYCGAASELVKGNVIYPYDKRWDTAFFWHCSPCGAYVGCHHRTKKPLGRLADLELRRAKMRAHEAFDPLWRSGRMSRNEAYGWLARKLGIPTSECHIGMFDTVACNTVVRLCREFSLTR
jgi:hypothetical protein